MKVVHITTQLITELKTLAAYHEKSAALYDHLIKNNNAPTFRKFVDNQFKFHRLLKEDLLLILRQMGIDHSGKYERYIDQFGERIKHPKPSTFLVFANSHDKVDLSTFRKNLKRYDSELIRNYKKTLQIRPLSLQIESTLLRHVAALYTALEWLENNKDLIKNLDFKKSYDIVTEDKKGYLAY